MISYRFPNMTDDEVYRTVVRNRLDVLRRNITDENSEFWEFRVKDEVTISIMRENLITRPEWMVPCILYLPITDKDVLQHPNLAWDYDVLSYKKTITFNLVRKLINKPWNFEALSKNPTIIVDDVFEFKNKLWNWEYLMDPHYNNKNMFNMNDILRFPLLPWKWSQITRYKGFDIELVYSNPDLPFPWRSLTKQVLDSGRFDFIVSNLQYNWCWFDITLYCVNEGVDDKLIQPELPLDDYRFIKSYVHLYDGFDPKYVIAHLEFPWNTTSWKLASVYAVKHMGFDFIRANMQYAWDWDIITEVFVNTFNDVESILDLPLNWDIISTKPVTIQQVNKYSTEAWNWEKLASNPAISTGDIFLYPNLPWVWEQIWVSTSHDDRLLIVNEKDNDYLINKKAYVIQKAWKQAILNPSYTLCRKRLKKEFDELSLSFTTCTNPTT